MADDAVLAALEALNARLDRIESRLIDDESAKTLGWALEGLGNARDRTPVFVDAVATVGMQGLNTALEAGIDPVETGTWALDTGLKAVSPEARALVDTALTPDNIKLLQRALEQSELIELALTAGEALAEALEGKDIDALAKRAARLATLLEAPEIDMILDSGALGSEGLTVAGAATTALVEARNEIAPVGPIGAFFKLGDPDVQKAVGFALAVAKRFGARLP
jgi:uncharacterized protein YjgD (DUF1641 family)